MNYLNLSKRAFLDKRKLPVYLIFFVTSRCNARCNHCFYWQKTTSESDELTLGEIEKMTQTIGTLFHVNLTGGEPFLRKDLSDIVALFYKHCGVRSFAIPTNGYNPRLIYDVAEKTLERCPGIRLQIGVSLEQLYETHDQIRNLENLFQNSIKTVRFLKKLNSKGLIVGVNLTLTTENEKDIEKIYHFISNRLRPNMISPLLVRGNVREPLTKDVSIASYKKMIYIWINDTTKRFLRGYHGNFFDWFIANRDFVARNRVIGWLEGKTDFFECMAGTLAAVVYEDGEVHPCELLLESLGNLRKHDYNFKEIWFSEKTANTVAKIKRDKCWCTHECFQSLNAVFNTSGIIRILMSTLKMKPKKENQHDHPRFIEQK